MIGEVSATLLSVNCPLGQGLSLHPLDVHLFAKGHSGPASTSGFKVVPAPPSSILVEGYRSKFMIT